MKPFIKPLLILICLLGIGWMGATNHWLAMSLLFISLFGILIFYWPEIE